MLFCLFALPFLLTTFGIGCIISAPASIWCICASILGITILFGLIARQPAVSVTQTVPWIPWLPMMCMIMCTALGSQVMEIVWPGVLLWISAGELIIATIEKLCCLMKDVQCILKKLRILNKANKQIDKCYFFIIHKLKIRLYLSDSECEMLSNL